MARVTQAHIDARREEILGAARRLFLRQGFRTVTMQDIAREAGLSAGAIYRYYDSRDDLVRAFFQQCVGEGPATMVRQIAPDARPLARLAAISSAVKQMWVERNGEDIISDIHAKMAGIREPEEFGPLVRDAREQLYGALLEIVEEGQRIGEIDPRFDPRALVVSMNAFVMGIGLIALEAGEEEMAQQLDMMFEVFNDVLGRLGPASDGGANLLDEE